MKKKMPQVVSLICLVGWCATAGLSNKNSLKELSNKNSLTPHELFFTVRAREIDEPIVPQESRHAAVQETLTVTEVDIDDEAYWDSLEYVAMCVDAEAGNQGYLGKVYVADCILNRFDKGGFKNYYEVINAPGQFSCVDNGSINRVPTEETYEIVRNELYDRTNSEVIYFRTGHYHSFGTPLFQHGAHYFSK